MERVKSFEYPDAKNVVVCGDIHGEFDTLLIVAGDCGFGFVRQTWIS